MKSVVVSVHYRMPEERLRSWLEWNAPAFSASGVKVLIVTDRAYDNLPAWARALIYPRPLTIFSLTKTANYGIRQAIDQVNAEIVVKTDADIVFSVDALAECLAVELGQAVAPLYQMVDSYPARHCMTQNRLMADLAIGTVAMRAQGWAEVYGYNENLEGYGCDDGDLWERIGKAGLARYRGLGVYHIAHAAGAVQVEAHCHGDKSRGVRSDHWGRADQFNPLRLRENMRLTRISRWRDVDWGRARS